MTTSWTRPTRGTRGAPVLVVCDAPSAQTYVMGLPMSTSQLKWLGQPTEPVIIVVIAGGPLDASKNAKPMRDAEFIFGVKTVLKQRSDVAESTRVTTNTVTFPRG